MTYLHTLNPYPEEIIHVRSEEDARKALNRLVRYDFLGYDTETYHSVDNNIKAFNPADGAKTRLMQFCTPDAKAYVFDMYQCGRDWIYKLFPNQMLLIIQNAKFEIKYLQHEFGIYEFGPIWDTMVAEQIISRGRVTGKGMMQVGLDKIAHRRLDIYLPKDEQASSWYRKEHTESQLQYAAMDASVVMPIWEIQRDMIRNQGQSAVAELEFDVIPALAWMENNGVYLNQDKWLSIYHDSEMEAEMMKRRLWHLLGSQKTLFDDIPTIKLTSQPKVLKALQDAGIDVPVDEKGKVSIASNNLKGLLDREEVQLYTRLVTLQTQMKMFGKNYLKYINPFTGRVHCNLKGIGAETGRMAAASPNLMQIKKDELYRNAFEPHDGWVFIDTDFSQCELRILAELSKDPNMIKAFDNNYDMHQYSASLIFKLAMEEVSKAQRGIAKNLNFGIVYGIGLRKFAINAGITEEDAKPIFDYYLKEAYPMMGAYLENTANEVLRTFESYTMLGRIRRYQIDFGDKQAVAEVKRNAKNMRVQGANADITKRALALMYKAIVGLKWQNTICKMNLVIHDELLTEARPDYAIDVQTIQENCMLKAEREFLFRVPSKVDTTITRVWCKEPTKEQEADAAQLIKDWGGEGGKPF